MSYDARSADCIDQALRLRERGGEGFLHLHVLARREAVCNS
jgi:hypothetical protein